jgi:hypothetical protein
MTGGIMLLKFKLTKDSFQILDQDMTYFAFGFISFSFVSQAGWRIIINRYPQVIVESKRIFLRGSTSLRDNEISMFFSCNGKTYQEILNTFIDFCKQRGFKLFELNDNVYIIGGENDT